MAQEIKAAALDAGFDLVGITDASPIPPEQARFLADWLKAGYAGQMQYMYRDFEKRTNPARLLPGAQSVIVVGLNYKPAPQKPRPRDVTQPTGRVSAYAQYEDYHLFIRRHLRKLIDFVTSTGARGREFKICVDSAPLAERALAARAGLGFIGKNHTLTNPTLGPQILLGEIITIQKLDIDEPVAEGCAGCNKCIDACPTGALRADGRLDANRCISYLTIEYKGSVSGAAGPDFAEKVGNRLFGCDECVLACPYRQNAPVCKNRQFRFYPDRAELDLQEILTMTAESWDARFADSPIKRLGLAGLKRNAQICLANLNCPDRP